MEKISGNENSGKSHQLNGLVQEGRKWLFQVKFFSFKSAWIFACAFQLSSTTFPCIFFAWFALCFWEKQRQNIEACTMNTTKQNKSISARKMIQENVFLLNWKVHGKIQALLKEKKFHLKKSLTSLLYQAIHLFFCLHEHIFTICNVPNWTRPHNLQQLGFPLSDDGYVFLRVGNISRPFLVYFGDNIFPTPVG